MLPPHPLVSSILLRIVGVDNSMQTFEGRRFGRRQGGKYRK
jgi:hypothetical protein